MFKSQDSVPGNLEEIRKIDLQFNPNTHCPIDGSWDRIGGSKSSERVFHGIRAT